MQYHTTPLRLVTVCLVGLGLGQLPAAADPPALSGRWHLNETTDQTTQDSSGKGNHGTVFGTTVARGRFGNGLEFQPGEYVQVAGNPTLEPAQITVEAWVNRDGSPGTFQYILSKGANDCFVASYALYTGGSGGLIFYVSDESSFTLSPDAGTAIWDGDWHHVAGTYDGVTVRLYVDGTQVGIGTPSTITGIAYGLAEGNDLFFGRFNGSCVLDFSGTLDEIRVWSVVLTPAAIARHARSNSVAR